MKRRHTITPRWAIRVGMVVAYGPAFLLILTALVGALWSLVYVNNSLRMRSLAALVAVVVLFACLGLAWLWWSLTVSRWRAWADGRVRRRGTLESSAISAGLTLPGAYRFDDVTRYDPPAIPFRMYHVVLGITPGISQRQAASRIFRLVGIGGVLMLMPVLKGLPDLLPVLLLACFLLMPVIRHFDRIRSHQIPCRVRRAIILCLWASGSIGAAQLALAPYWYRTPPGIAEPIDRDAFFVLLFGFLTWSPAAAFYLHRNATYKPGSWAHVR